MEIDWGNLPMVMVEWIDSEGDTGGWESPESRPCTIIKSIGFLLEIGDDHIQLIGEYDEKNGNTLRRISIPKVAITDIKKCQTRHDPKLSKEIMGD